MTGGKNPDLSSRGAQTVPLTNAVKSVFRGIGQVFFQENALTGLLFTLGIGLSSPPMAVAAVVGSAIGAATARMLKFDRPALLAGIYGFNSALVGIATLFFFQPGAASFALLVAGCIVAVLLARLAQRLVPFPTYTLAFIVTTWALYYLGLTLDLPEVEPVAGPTTDSLFAAIVRGVGQVKFQANGATGLLFLAGIALNNWRHALWVLTASVLSVLGAVFHNAPTEGIALGLYGYNAPLTALALYLWRPSLITPLFGILLCIPITEYVPMLGLPALTLPFVLTTWLVLALLWIEKRVL
jgi:urea transporter